MSAEADQRTTCTACRGTGVLISNLNGTPHQVTCPWCGGDGVFHPGRDAQAESQPAEASAPSEPPDTAA